MNAVFGGIDRYSLTYWSTLQPSSINQSFYSSVSSGTNTRKEERLTRKERQGKEEDEQEEEEDEQGEEEEEEEEEEDEQEQEEEEEEEEEKVVQEEELQEEKEVSKWALLGFYAKYLSKIKKDQLHSYQI